MTGTPSSPRGPLWLAPTSREPSYAEAWPARPHARKRSDRSGRNPAHLIGLRLRIPPTSQSHLVRETHVGTGGSSPGIPNVAPGSCQSLGWWIGALLWDVSAEETILQNTRVVRSSRSWLDSCDLFHPALGIQFVAAPHRAVCLRVPDMKIGRSAVRRYSCLRASLTSPFSDSAKQRRCRSRSGTHAGKYHRNPQDLFPRMEPKISDTQTYFPGGSGHTGGGFNVHQMPNSH